jgi:hypothetical protein
MARDTSSLGSDTLGIFDWSVVVLLIEECASVPIEAGIRCRQQAFGRDVPMM